MGAAAVELCAVEDWGGIPMIAWGREREGGDVSGGFLALRVFYGLTG